MWLPLFLEVLMLILDISPRVRVGRGGWGESGSDMLAADDKETVELNQYYHGPI